MSDHVRALRDRIGDMLLEVPTVAVLVRDAERRVLLVRHVEGYDWTTPGGMIEPYETPADAAVREMWEETGLFVQLTRIIGVFGGPDCASVYGNGDQMAWVCTVFEATVRDGELRPDGDETLDARYFTEAEARALESKPHVRLCLDALYREQGEPHFQPATWRPATL